MRRNATRILFPIFSYREDGLNLFLWFSSVTDKAPYPVSKSLFVIFITGDKATLHLSEHPLFVLVIFFCSVFLEYLRCHRGQGLNIYN